MLGSGYVGLVAGVCFADAGHKVIGVDSDLEKIERLKEGRLPFYEPGLNDLFQRNHKRMIFTNDVKEAVKNSHVIFIAVGTPELPDGSADLGPTMKAVQEICEVATESKTVVLKSTVPIGSSRQVKAYFGEHSEWPIDVVNNP